MASKSAAKSLSARKPAASKTVHPAVFSLVPFVSGASAAGARAPVCAPTRLQNATSYIGRTRQNDVVVVSDNVSRRHAKIIVSNSGMVVVHDLDSHNGVFLNGKKVRSASVQVGDLLYVADVCLQLRRSCDVELFDSDSGSVTRVKRSDITSEEEDYDARSLAALLRAGELLAKGDAVGEPVILQILELCRGLLDATDGVLVQLVDGEMVTHLSLATKTGEGERAPLLWSLLQQAFDEARPLLVADLERDPIEVALVTPRASRLLGAVMVIPLPVLTRSGDEPVVEAMYFARPTPGPMFTAREMTTLSAIAQMVVLRREPALVDAVLIDAQQDALTEEGHVEHEEAKRDVDVATSGAELAKGEADAARRDIDAAYSGAEVAKGEADAARREVDDAKREADDAKREVAAARVEAEAARREVAAAHSGAEAAKGEADAGRREAAAARVEAEAARRELDAAYSGAEAAKGEADAGRREAAAARVEAEAARREVDDAKREVAAARGGAEAAKGEPDAGRREAAAARVEAEAARREVDDAKREVAAARREAEAARVEVDDAKREVAAARSGAEAATGEAAAARGDAAATRLEAGAARREADAGRRDAEASLAVAAELDFSHQEVARVNALLHQSHDELQAARAELVKTVADHRAAAEILRNAMRATVPPGMAEHIEAAAQDQQGLVTQAHVRPVAALYITMRGFDSWAVTASPDDIKRSLDHFCHAVALRARENGGRVEQVLGHAHLLMFAADAVAVRAAVLCGLEVTQLVAAQLGGEAGSAGVACGLHVGSSASGYFGEGATATHVEAGEAILVARGIAALAQDPLFVVTGAVRQLVKDEPAFALAMMGPAALIGGPVVALFRVMPAVSDDAGGRA